MDEFRPCPYCGEEIRTAATRCRFCRSRLTALDPDALSPREALEKLYELRRLAK